MIDAITVQHIERRRPSNRTLGVKTFRRRARKYTPAPAFVSIERIKQNPVHKKRLPRPKTSPGKILRAALIKNNIPFRFPLPRLFSRPRPVLREPEPKTAGGGKKAALRGFSLIPAAALTVLAALSLFTQDWRREEDRVSPPEDPLYRRDLASYAGLLPQGASLPEEEGIPLDLMESFAWKSYTVKRGDSVSRIAAEYAISMDAIIASNGITNARRLYEGQTIRIPNMDGIPYTVKSGDSLTKIAAAMKVPLPAILDANDLRSDTISAGTVLFIPGAKMRSEDLKLALGELFIYPIRGRLTSPYGWRNDPISGARRYHAALDLAAPEGTPIKAAMDGRVSTVGRNSVYGNYIILSHSGGYQTLYGHLSRTSVSQGAPVNQGTKIGEVGNTGYSTGPHLHFAVYKNGRAVNPQDLLSP